MKFVKQHWISLLIVGVCLLIIYLIYQVITGVITSTENAISTVTSPFTSLTNWWTNWWNSSPNNAGTTLNPSDNSLINGVAGPNFLSGPFASWFSNTNNVANTTTTN
jgi:predicted PurR-regulated permease PerM